MDRSIVVPLDLVGPHRAALGVAGALARRSGAVVRLVTVSSPGLDHTKDKLELDALAGLVDATDVRTEIVESNETTTALLDAAGADGLLCLETRARGPLGAMVLGSVASDVLRRATRPVVLVGPACRPELPNGLLEVCIDGPDAAASLVPVAVEWSRSLGVRPRLVGVWVPGAPHRLPNPEAMQALLERSAGGLSDQMGVEVDWEFLQAPGAPAAIVDDAERHRASLVAVAVRPHHRLQRVLGSVAMAVAHATSAAVVAVPCEQPATSG